MGPGRPPNRIGSSPRPWGTRSHRSAPPTTLRFIPTPVGNAGSSRPAAQDRSVHPHARGERFKARTDTPTGSGSSPRPWGTLLPASDRYVHPRFIPTPVGNAPIARVLMAARAVHPHARGERLPRAAAMMMSSGSSPRPWGTRLPGQGGARQRRFIPTPVGNAMLPLPFAAVPNGSSPRPWGTPRSTRSRRTPARFIPTPVGNAKPRTHRPRRSAVHPHARGERLGCQGKPGRSAGSSPRPWGTRDGSALHQLGRRFIPTPVGNARTECPAASMAAVHPHARGERLARVSRCVRVTGSSPRPWGTLDRVVC